jgi:hypothetical protein
VTGLAGERVEVAAVEPDAEVVRQAELADHLHG